MLFLVFFLKEEINPALSVYVGGNNSVLRQKCCYYDFTDVYHPTTTITGAIKISGVAAASVENEAGLRSPKPNCRGTISSTL